MLERLTWGSGRIAVPDFSPVRLVRWLKVRVWDTVCLWLKGPVSAWYRGATLGRRSDVAAQS